MKKIFTTFLAILVMASFSFAQNTKPATKKTEKKAATTKMAGPKMKKDGTPDKRYKENNGPKLKKDGTPDMRYKENKAAKKDAKPMKKANTAPAAK